MSLAHNVRLKPKTAAASQALELEGWLRRQQAPAYGLGPVHGLYSLHAFCHLLAFMPIASKDDGYGFFATRVPWIEMPRCHLPSSSGETRPSWFLRTDFVWRHSVQVITAYK